MGSHLGGQKYLYVVIVKKTKKTNILKYSIINNITVLGFKHKHSKEGQGRVQPLNTLLHWKPIYKPLPFVVGIMISNSYDI